MGSEVPGGKLSKGNLYNGGNYQHSSFLFVFLSLCRFNFICGDIKGYCPGEIFTELELSKVSFRRWGDFPREKFPYDKLRWVFVIKIFLEGGFSV